MWELPDSQNLMTYGVTKNSGTLLYQVIADETLAEKMQIISVHPGTIFTEVWQNYGVDKTYLPFDEGKYQLLYHQLLRIWIDADSDSRGPARSVGRLGFFAGSSIPAWPLRLGFLGCRGVEKWTSP